MFIPCAILLPLVPSRLPNPNRADDWYCTHFKRLDTTSVSICEVRQCWIASLVIMINEPLVLFAGVAQDNLPSASVKDIALVTNKSIPAMFVIAQVVIVEA